jgi:Tfp pilus assembly protein PilO
MDISNKKRIMLPLMITILVIMWFTGIYLPISRETGILNKRISSLQIKMGKEIPELKIKMIKIVVDSLNNQLNNLEQRFYPENELLELGRLIEKIGKRFGLSLVSVTPDYESLSLLIEKKEEVFELPMKTEFKGTFRQFTKFMDAIPELPFVFKVSGVYLLKESQSHPELKIQLQGVIVLKKERKNENMQKVDILTDQT